MNDDYEDRLSNLAAYNVAMSAARRRTAYLAGPGILSDDARRHGEALKALCARYMLDGLWPLDNLTDAMGAKTAFAIRTETIRRADIVIADIRPLHGTAGLDGCTAWEIGYATALRKPVYAYTDDLRDARAGLMVSCCVIGPFGSAEEAVREAYADSKG